MRIVFSRWDEGVRLRQVAGMRLHGLQEAFAPCCIGFEHAGEMRGDHRRRRLVHGAQRHALMAAAIITATPRGANASWIVVGDLRRQRLLHLQAAREDIDDARQLRQPDHAAARNVGDMRDAGEWRDVVLAMALEAHVAQQDHVGVAGDSSKVRASSAAASSR